MYPDGDIYTGEWANGKASGYGTFFSEKGLHYEGEWLEDQFHGQGTEWFNYDQGYYKGEFAHSKKSGKGIFKMQGVTYEGDFLDGQFHGKGKYTFVEQEGKVYVGEFFDN